MAPAEWHVSCDWVLEERYDCRLEQKVDRVLRTVASMHLDVSTSTPGGAMEYDHRSKRSSVLPATLPATCASELSGEGDVVRSRFQSRIASVQGISRRPGDSSFHAVRGMLQRRVLLVDNSMHGSVRTSTSPCGFSAQLLMSPL